MNDTKKVFELENTEYYWYGTKGSWAIIEEQQDNNEVIVHFTSWMTIIDELRFNNRDEAINGLIRNGFRKYDDRDEYDIKFARPSGLFHRTHNDSETVYSSGEKWHGTPLSLINKHNLRYAPNNYERQMLEEEVEGDHTAKSYLDHETKQTKFCKKKMRVEIIGVASLFAWGLMSELILHSVPDASLHMIIWVTATITGFVVTYHNGISNEQTKDKVSYMIAETSRSYRQNGHEDMLNRGYFPFDHRYIDSTTCGESKYE